jgi:hypothetical protein
MHHLVQNFRLVKVIQGSLIIPQHLFGISTGAQSECIVWFKYISLVKVFQSSSIIITPKHGKYDYISDWRCSPKPHIQLAMTTRLLLHMAPWYLPLVAKNGVAVNAICKYIFHDYRTSSMAKF